jgi:Transposase DDE domain group 1
MHDDTIESFGFPAVRRTKITAAVDGGGITSDGSVMLLVAAERRLGIAQRLASLIAYRRNPLLITNSVLDIFRSHVLAIACDYEDADDSQRPAHWSRLQVGLRAPARYRR